MKVLEIIVALTMKVNDLTYVIYFLATFYMKESCNGMVEHGNVMVRSLENYNCSD